MTTETVETTEVQATVAGVPFKIKGWGGILVGIIAVLGIGLALMVKFSLSQWGTPFPIESAIKANQEAVLTEIRSQGLKWSAEHTALNANLEELTFVMSICLNQARAKECGKIDIQMPDSLRRKMRRLSHED